MNVQQLIMGVFIFLLGAALACVAGWFVFGDPDAMPSIRETTSVEMGPRKSSSSRVISEREEKRKTYRSLAVLVAFFAEILLLTSALYICEAVRKAGAAPYPRGAVIAAWWVAGINSVALAAVYLFWPTDRFILIFVTAGVVALLLVALNSSLSKDKGRTA